MWYFSEDTTVPSTETNTSQTTPTDTSATSTPTTGSETSTSSDTPTVTYTSGGYTPATITVAPGQTVMFANDSTVDMWAAADEHPTHTEYDGTSRTEHCTAAYTGPASFDSCKRIPPGGTWSFTFTKAGTFDYHDHVDASKRGRVIVSGTAVSGSVNVNVE